ncbi:uncharacterized protein CTRU02_204404 [Colletotrichum truncatum]|uniref:Uncharacterized protein n=1 Tax=Colletotrichum truncatum TaxID=5467 RepID=A0ACC3ZC03_COLTU|nr:uncharacterized protein CTRU02_14384 [Colletotrichum truncatum]KAF6782198.1 hypothetical protein CTRU02_14384 [Colletotrichum truncatum]
MAELPSYQDAISRLDWLELVAPYVQCKDFANLCSVNRRFYATFAPRLWSDPLVTVRRLGLDPSDDLEWYLTFAFDRTKRLRESTRALVNTLDFRDFAKDTAHFSSDNSTRTLPESLRWLPRIFPDLRSVLLDGHAEADPAFLIASPPSEVVAAPPDHHHHHQQHLLVLSMAHCETQLPSAFFTSYKLQRLTYLDVSGLPGSLQPLLVAAHGRRHLAHLKVLKVGRREINDGLAMQLFQTFKGALWSLDMSGNNITDAILDSFAALCFNSPSLRSHSRFMTEGKLTFDGHGNDSHGRFMSIQESEWSATFSHPERYFVDAPIYSADATRDLQEYEAVRANGKTPLRRDTVDHVKAAVAGSMDRRAPAWSDVPHLDVCNAPAGITHLHLSDTQITSAGVDRLVRISQGQLEEFSCDGSLFQPVQCSDLKHQLPWLKSVRLYGVMGCAHVFRPVLSSNLRVLRIHHSLVTQIPTLETDGLSTMARLWIAETVIRDRSEMAFPQAFEPDMNPRLTSLTLRNIPRRSAGPLIQKILRFLKLMGIQEHAIREASQSTSRRSPALLHGLRHLRLEFEADPIEDPAGFSVADDLDAEGLMSMGEGEGFSFFGNEQSQPRSQNPPKKQAEGREAVVTHLADLSTGRLNRFPYDEIEGDYMGYRDTWSGQPFDRKVWIGPGVLGPSHAINEYMKLVTNSSLRTRVGPATPAHIKAGVPVGALLFHAAWDAMIMPSELKPPTTVELHGMRDVLEAVKTFRLESRAGHEAAKKAAVGGTSRPGGPPQHGFWSGRLEVFAQQSMAHYRTPNYWR